MSVEVRHKLVVIGSGWAGLYIAQHIDTGLYDVTVVSSQPTCALTPLLASAACGILPFDCAEESIRAKNRKCKYIRADAVGVNFENKLIHCQAAAKEDSVASPAFELSYEYLVICPGCRTNTFDTPGVEKHALFIKNVNDAVALRRTLFDRLESANLPHMTSEERSRLLHIVIVGGGPTGVEITAELSDLAQRQLKELYPSAAEHLKISIYDVAEHILGAYEQQLYTYATNRLRERGIEVATGSIIEKVDERYLHVKDHDPVPYGILLWVAGNKSVPLVDLLDVKKTQHGLRRILTDECLRVKKDDNSNSVYPDVFAIGDAADIESQPLPTTAEVAVQKARFLVQRLNKSRQDLRPAFEYKRRHLVTYIGSHDGIRQGWSADSPYAGSQAWLEWRAGNFTWSRTWRSWANVGWAMLMNAVFGRDAMVL